MADARRGSPTRALEGCLQLLAAAPGHRGAASLALVLAARLGRPSDRAEALVHLARPVWPALRSVLLAAAADAATQLVGSVSGAAQP